MYNDLTSDNTLGDVQQKLFIDHVCCE